MAMAPIIVTILMHVILCHVVQRQKPKFIVAHTRMGYVVVERVAVPKIQFIPQLDVFPKLEAPRQ